MPEIVNAEVEHYALEHTSPPGQALASLADGTRSEFADRSGMMVGALEGRFLEALVFGIGARRILEIGTFTGYSSIAMAAGMPRDGKIITCELSPVHADLARRHIAASPFGDRIELREGPALETIASLDGLFDFVFIDADKGSYIDYYEATLTKLAPRGLLAADNTLWSGRVVDASDQSQETVAIRRFNDHVRLDRRVICVQLTIRDGVTLVRLAGPGDLAD
ncbi:MAG TPA: class I SAM-dependent methyltransferase [Acidimicrobiales bacterium]|nr:class I SAM-dependent methyltransferase [Acidimicrobiales bacterium]